jgi:proline racemase
MKAGETYIGRSVIESRFMGRIAEETSVGGKPAIIPEITGRAWISGQTTLLLDPS